ncbi:TDP-N-acetylfucosamine:lipid II N-acetylfucosaminyltransferase [Lacibacter sp. H407]|uniref:TDP-N-acetylfucosamine:lipid II N-acetylfucosaminyltransferase n=1 Tax=Lacibacter sp. H407 TaxID=3133423 RepID=UPI0030C5CAD6
MRIVHIMIFEKFIRGYIEFVVKEFDVRDHHFYIVGKDYKKYNLDNLPNVTIVDNYYKLLKFVFAINRSQRIILHGLWHEGVIRLLLLQPWLIKKCYWMMWGGDFYYYDSETVSKKRLIKKLQHFVGFVRGDYEFVREKYGAAGEFHESILYTVAFFEELVRKRTAGKEESIKILVGNSADPSNNHLQIFEILLPFKDAGIEVIVPLSYGNESYRNDVVEKGAELFGDHFKPLLDFIPLDQYKKMLTEIQIGIFNHGRQQGLGNIITLLSYGKKVFLRKDVTTWGAFKDLGVTLYDIKEFTLTDIDPETRKENIQSMKQYFTPENYKTQLTRLFYSNQNSSN